VAAATYVVYVSSILASGSLLRAATILMFVVGVAKYGERVWALKYVSGSAQGGNYQPLIYTSGSHYRNIPSKSCPDKEDYLLDAHLFWTVPKKFLMSML
jgi:hypothetical protein